jgi:hypothetical protein
MSRPAKTCDLPAPPFLMSLDGSSEMIGHLHADGSNRSTVEGDGTTHQMTILLSNDLEIRRDAFA